MTVSPLKLRCYLPEQVALLNQLYVHNSGVPFSMGGEEYLLFFETALPLLQPAIGLVIELSDTGPSLLELGTKSLLDSLAGFMDGVDVATLPEPLQLAAVEAYLEAIFDNLSLNGLDGRVADIRFGPGELLPDCALLYFRLLRRSDGMTAQGRLCMPWAGVADMVRAMSRLPEAPQTSIRGVPVPLTLEAGEVRLTLDEYKNLEPGDVLLAGTMMPLKKLDAGTPLELVARIGGRFRYQAQLTQKTITIMHPLVDMMHEEDMEQDFYDQDEELSEAVADTGDDESIADMGSDEPIADVGQVEVNLVFELGRTTLTVDELSTIRSGHVFEMSAPVDQAVTLRANGKNIGRGVLVDVGGRVGVQVLQLGQSK